MGIAGKSENLNIYPTPQIFFKKIFNNLTCGVIFPMLFIEPGCGQKFNGGSGLPLHPSLVFDLFMTGSYYLRKFDRAA